MILNNLDRQLIEAAKEAIDKNYDIVNWWHTVGAAVLGGEYSKILPPCD